MRLLLDTCALLWLADDREQLSDAALDALSKKDTQLLVSAISAFEIAVKVRKGKLALTRPVRDWFMHAVSAFSLLEIPVSSTIAVYSCEVPLTHNDPADRIIVATAILEGIPVVTSDHLILDCPGLATIW
ncbi:MAG: type II toxin-antitoxin system VapC family toxin [Polyangiaceae bacterium]|nr:type II toxin-antitoxin system VapC family toxin [Polyangiaceae bacterium]